MCASGWYYELKTASGSRAPLVLPQQVKTRSWGYLGHGGEGIGGKEPWLWLSEVQTEPRHQIDVEGPEMLENPTVFKTAPGHPPELLEYSRTVFPKLCFWGPIIFKWQTIMTQFTIGLIYKKVRRTNLCINEHSWKYLLPIPQSHMNLNQPFQRDKSQLRFMHLKT